MKNIGYLDIGGHNYEITEEELVSPKADRELYGRHEVITSKIRINKNISISRKKETLIHEVLHAVLMNGGHEHPEDIIDCISNGFFQLGVGDYLWKKSQKK